MRLLVIRTSAMGDVALTTPVLIGMRKQYPDIELVLLTRKVFKPFFSSIEGLQLFFPDLKDRHNGLPGLIRLFKDINKQGKIDCVIDLHDVLRSKILCLLFRFSGIRVSTINKGRIEKRAVINGKTKIRLKHSVERYCDVFSKAGFPVIPHKGQSIFPTSEAIGKASVMTATHGELNIGVAPYAKHKLKMWPEENMIRLLGLISGKHKTRFWLFGGNEESERLSALQLKIANSVSIVGNLTLDEELALMSKLDLMIAMDSSNMHMAALVGTKVISIWGGTDPINGFGAWMQPEAFSVSIPFDELTCRPCTTYGKGDCRRGDLACMNWLKPEIVLQKLDNLKIW
ncbi:MAG: glycosyltransferase family 9 protein [Bacteroidetes bacterium]|nr:MAG: glycosyltransferase family 9 protein [Bacteroidota bacterium]